MPNPKPPTASQTVVYSDLALFIVAALKMLNQFSKEHEKNDGPTHAYLGEIPVKMEGEVIGYFCDELGGDWCFKSGEAR